MTFLSKIRICIYRLQTATSIFSLLLPLRNEKGSDAVMRVRSSSSEHWVIWMIDITQKSCFLDILLLCIICKSRHFEVVQLQYLLWPADACKHHQIILIRLFQRPNCCSLELIYIAGPVWLFVFHSVPFNSRCRDYWNILLERNI